MSDTANHEPDEATETRDLLPWERWIIDEYWGPIIEFDHEAHARWCEKWAPPCPDGNPQRLRRALGFWERSCCELELRVALGADDLGVCDVIVDEYEHEVYVRVLVCYDPSDEERRRRRDYMDWPVRTWLDHPLGERAVIDIDSDEELPLFIPLYLNNTIQPDHGYRPANRRRRAQ